jgi:hypothetical protein
MQAHAAIRLVDRTAFVEQLSIFVLHLASGAGVGFVREARRPIAIFMVLLFSHALQGESQSFPSERFDCPLY